MLQRLLTIVLAACTLAVAAREATADPSHSPERIEPLRKHGLSAQRYRELEQEWKAYTVAYPNEPVGWSQLAKATYYSGDSGAVAIGYAERAVRLGPDDPGALATLGGWKWVCWCDGQPTDPDEAIALLERALKIDPDLDDPHIRLWVMRLSKGQQEAADAELRSLLDRGRIPEPLLDLAYNLAVGLEPNAILLTNGDNDTYPLVALQAARGFRADVAVVNLSMLNLGWYRRELRTGRHAVPVPLLDQDPRSVTGSAAAVKGLIENLARNGWKRPLYMACTVDVRHYQMPNQLSLEGVAYRVLAKPGSATELDTSRVARNLKQVYRLESATSPGLDWEAWSSVRQLMFNYVAPDLQLAAARAKSGNLVGVGECMMRSLSLCEFHHSDYVRDLVRQWSTLDPRSPDLVRWKKKLGM